MQETRVQFLGWEDPLEKEMATHSSTLAWRIPWMEEPGGLQSTGSQRGGHEWVTSLSLSFFHSWTIRMEFCFLLGLSLVQNIHCSLNSSIQSLCLFFCPVLSGFSGVQLFATPWTVAYQAPLSMGFSRQEYWSGLPFPSPGDLPDPGIEPRSPTLQADSLLSEPPGKPNTFLFTLN